MTTAEAVEKTLPRLKQRDQITDLLGVPVRPVRLWQHIIDEVEPALFQQRECFVQVRVLARPRIGKDQVEPDVGDPAQHVACILHVERHPRIVSEPLLCYGCDGWIVLDREQA